VKTKLSASFFILTLFASLFIAVFPLSRIAIAQTTPENDLKRRRLETLRECITRYLDDDNDETIDGIDDFFTKADQRIVVGFDRDSDNGVMTCRTVVLQGWRTLGSFVGLGQPVNDGSSDINVINSFAFAMTNSDFIREPNGIDSDVDNLRNNASGVVQTIDSTLDRPELARPGDLLRKRRIVEGHDMIQICFDEVRPSTDRAGALPDNSFTVTLEDGTEVDLYAGDSAAVENRLQDAGFVTEDGGSLTRERNKLGDISLGWVFRTGVGAGDFNNFNSDFYPLGNDIGQGGTEGTPGVWDCSDIESNKDWLERDFVLDGDYLALSDENGDLINPPAGIDEGEGDEEPTCEENFDFAFSWLVCAAIGLLDSAIGAMINTIDNMLSVGPEEYNNADVQEAWSYFRNIASFLLVVIGLVMIIGQAVSKE